MQENEDEKLSKEEQDLAWEVYQRTLKSEEVQHATPHEHMPDHQHKISTNTAPRHPQRPVSKSTVDRKPVLSTVVAPESDALAQARHRHQNRFLGRKCTNLSHLLTLRSQGTKMGCTTICGECAQEIKWEDLNRDGKLVK